MTDFATGILWIVGSSFAFLAALGVLRMPDVFTRMQASTKASTLGLGCLLIGAALQLARSGLDHSPLQYRGVYAAHDSGIRAPHCARGIPGRHTAMGWHRARRTSRGARASAGERTAGGGLGHGILQTHSR